MMITGFNLAATDYRRHRRGFLVLVAACALLTIALAAQLFVWVARLLKKGHDVTLFGTGVMTSLCLRAADLLTQEGIEAEVIHLASIKPIDQELIIDSVRRTGCAVTAENASVIGGFGSAVLEALAESHPVPLLRIGVQDRWVDSGSIDELFTFHKMQPVDIASAARQAIQLKHPFQFSKDP